MGDYPTRRKLCPEFDGIKLVSRLVLSRSVCKVPLQDAGAALRAAVILENDLLKQSTSL
jgi:hypothetical protein